MKFIFRCRTRVSVCNKDIFFRYKRSGSPLIVLHSDYYFFLLLSILFMKLSGVFHGKSWYMRKNFDFLAFRKRYFNSQWYLNLPTIYEQREHEGGSAEPHLANDWRSGGPDSLDSVVSGSQLILFVLELRDKRISKNLLSYKVHTRSATCVDIKYEYLSA